MSSEQNSIRSSASSTAARAAGMSSSRRASSARRSPSTPRYCGSRESRAERRGRAQVLARRVDVAAPELQLGVAQEPVELLRAARRAAAPVDLGGGALRLVPLARRRTRTARCRAAASCARARPGPRRALARDGERLRGAPGHGQRVGEVGVRHGEVLVVAVLARHRDRPAQRRGAVAPRRRARSRTRRARSARAASSLRQLSPGRPASSSSASCGDVDRGAVLRLHHQPLGALREQGRALGARRRRPRAARAPAASCRPPRPGASSPTARARAARRGWRRGADRPCARRRRRARAARAPPRAATSSLRRWQEAARSSTLASSSPASASASGTRPHSSSTRPNSSAPSS